MDENDKKDQKRHLYTSEYFRILEVYMSEISSAPFILDQQAN